jgi:hypothetical protein
LWHISNKLTIEKKVIKHASDYIYKSIVFLQLWALSARSQGKEEILGMAEELKEIVAAKAPPRIHQ